MRWPLYSQNVFFVLREIHETAVPTTEIHDTAVPTTEIHETAVPTREIHETAVPTTNNQLFTSWVRPMFQQQMPLHCCDILSLMKTQHTKWFFWTWSHYARLTKTDLPFVQNVQQAVPQVPNYTFLADLWNRYTFELHLRCAPSNTQFGSYTSLTNTVYIINWTSNARSYLRITNPIQVFQMLFEHQ